VEADPFNHKIRALEEAIAYAIDRSEQA